MIDSKYRELLARNSEGGGLTALPLGVWDTLLVAQTEMSITGNFIEVGVWTGIGLSAMGCHATDSEEIIGVDLYLQRDNIRSNFEAITGLSVSLLNLIEQSSRALAKSSRLDSLRGSFRWVHIDGEHSFDAVCSDIELAISLVKEEGIIVIDDFFNIGSASITEAVFFMLRRCPHHLRMFLAGANKAYLAHPRYFGAYKHICRTLLPGQLEKNFDLPITLSRNGHSTEIDYLTFFPRYGEFSAMKIGQFMKVIPVDL